MSTMTFYLIVGIKRDEGELMHFSVHSSDAKAKEQWTSLTWNHPELEVHPIELKV